MTATTTPDTPEHFNCGCYYPAILAPDSWANKPASLREVNYEKVTELSLHCPHSHDKYRENLFIFALRFPLKIKKQIAEAPLSKIFDWCLTILFMLHWHVSLSNMSNTRLTNNGQTEKLNAAFTIYAGQCFQQCSVLLFFLPKEWQTAKPVYADQFRLFPSSLKDIKSAEKWKLPREPSRQWCGGLSRYRNCLWPLPRLYTNNTACDTCSSIYAGLNW